MLNSRERMWPRKAKVILASFTALSLLTTAAVANAAASNVAPLAVSMKADRSSPIALAGATLKGNAYVFLSKASATSVTFYLDSTTTPVATESVAPYDLSSTASDGTARPLDTTKLANGPHSVKAIVKTNSRTRTYSASFSVNNAVAVPTTTSTTVKSTTTTTSTPASTTGLCSTIPAVPSQKPTIANTGVPAGTALTASGTITAATAGAVIDSKFVTGTIEVKANNVTIKNSKINVQGYYGINIADGVTGTKILNSELYTDNGGYIGILAASATVCGNYIHGFENGMTLGGGMVVQANFIEKLKSDSPNAHFDGIEIYSGSNTKLIGNNILMTNENGAWLGDTGAINLTTEWSNIDNVQISNNWIGGGSYTLYIRKSSSGSGYHYSNVSVTNNRWYGSAPRGFAAYGAVSDDGGLSVFTGNVWDATGAPI